MIILLIFARTGGECASHVAHIQATDVQALISHLETVLLARNGVEQCRWSHSENLEFPGFLEVGSNVCTYPLEKKYSISHADNTKKGEIACMGEYDMIFIKIDIAVF